MARSDTRYSVYPAPKAVEVVGNSSPALNQAIECWATLLTRAIADNARKFWNQYGDAASLTLVATPDETRAELLLPIARRA